MKPACGFVVAGHPGQCTGGYRYDAEIVSGLRALGWRVDVSGLPGRFPVVDGTARRALDACLRAHAPGTQVVIDGLALGGLPEVATAHARRLAITALVHHPLADESGLASATRATLFAVDGGCAVGVHESSDCAFRDCADGEAVCRAEECIKWRSSYIVSRLQPLRI